MVWALFVAGLGICNPHVSTLLIGFTINYAISGGFHSHGGTSKSSIYRWMFHSNPSMAWGLSTFLETSISGIFSQRFDTPWSWQRSKLPQLGFREQLLAEQLQTRARTQRQETAAPVVGVVGVLHGLQNGWVLSPPVVIPFSQKITALQGMTCPSLCSHDGWHWMTIPHRGEICNYM